MDARPREPSAWGDGVTVETKARTKLPTDADLTVSTIHYAYGIIGMPGNMILHVHPYAKQLANHLLYEAFGIGLWVYEHTKVVIHPEWSESEEDRWELEGPDAISWSPGA